MATDRDRNRLPLRIVSQPGHGTVALAATTARYFPDGGFVGVDTFTFAAWDGSTDSNLGTATVTVGSGGGGSGPDLAPRWISLSQRCVGANATRCRVRGKVGILNQGTLKARKSVLRFYLSPTPTLDGGAVLLRQVGVGMLAPGKRRKKVLAATVTAPATGRFVVAVADATNVVAEDDEGNNAAAAPIRSPSANRPRAPPATPDPGAPHERRPRGSASTRGRPHRESGHPGSRPVPERAALSVSCPYLQWRRPATASGTIRGAAARS